MFTYHCIDVDQFTTILTILSVIHFNSPLVVEMSNTIGVAHSPIMQFN